MRSDAKPAESLDPSSRAIAAVRDPLAREFLERLLREGEQAQGVVGQHLEAAAEEVPLE